MRLSFFGALFPQFIDAGAPVLPQLLILGVTYLVVDGLILVLWGWAAIRTLGRVRNLTGLWINRVSGAMMIGAAALLGLKDVSPAIRGDGKAMATIPHADVRRLPDPPRRPGMRLNGARISPCRRLAPGRHWFGSWRRGVNNTDINTRTGWYSKTVTGATDGDSGDDVESGGYAGALNFPLIQGGDLCGEVVATGADVTGHRHRNARDLRHQPTAPDPENPVAFEVIGSEYDGAFADYCCVPGGSALRRQRLTASATWNWARCPALSARRWRCWTGPRSAVATPF